MLLYAASTLRRRHARTEWSRSLDVALVLVRDGPIDPGALEALRARVPALEEKLTAELHRYRGAPDRPFRFVVRGPVELHAPRPEPAGEGTFDLAKHAWALWRWTARLDEAAALDTGAYDARVYVVLKAPATATRRFVEGASEQGGRIGMLEVDLDASMVDFALFVTTHELLHTIGALDKYGPDGNARIPDGLGDPEAHPLFPQTLAEPMARGRVIAPGREEPPDSLEMLRVGKATAREIGWID
ncbi:MAG: hypothetical protein HYV09_39860 [Deltaproteobacteria bacterium]|nr:hypothetical protein [Deltaproteobacteria bacterium]